MYVSCPTCVLRLLLTQFSDTLKDALSDPRCRNLNLQAFLIKPLQRLTKYPLLIRVRLR